MGSMAGDLVLLVISTSSSSSWDDGAGLKVIPVGELVLVLVVPGANVIVPSPPPKVGF